ncbi:MAG TPA: Mpo1-like protein [Terriglobia bacterium]|nr:Mpo1-like protein [Terriglobia bacterium]
MDANTVERLWSDYQEHHRTAGNRACHMIGIPLIMAGLLGLLALPIAHVAGWPVEASLLLVLVFGAVEIALDARLGALMLVISLAIYLGARLLGWQISAGIFVLGWVFQFIGHGAYEKRSPAFYKNLAHLVVGPLWVLNHVVHLRREEVRAPASAQG